MNGVKEFPWFHDFKQVWHLYNKKLVSSYIFSSYADFHLPEFAKNIAFNLLTNKGNNLQAKELFLRGSHPDFYHLKCQKDKAKISIDEIRELIIRLGTTAHQGGYKIAIIEDAELMSLEATNSLLKILEEPSRNTLIILTTTKFEFLIYTLKSRCIHLHFMTPKKEMLIKYLLENNKFKNIKQSEIEELLDINQYDPTKSLSMLNNSERLTYFEFKKHLFNVMQKKESMTEVVDRWYNIKQLDYVLLYFFYWVVFNLKEMILKNKFNKLFTQDLSSWFAFYNLIINIQNTWNSNYQHRLQIESIIIKWQDLFNARTDSM